MPIVDGQTFFGGSNHRYGSNSYRYAGQAGQHSDTWTNYTHTVTLGLISGGKIDEHYMYLNISEGALWSALDGARWREHCGALWELHSHRRKWEVWEWHCPFEISTGAAFPTVPTQINPWCPSKTNVSNGRCWTQIARWECTQPYHSVTRKNNITNYIC